VTFPFLLRVQPESSRSKILNTKSSALVNQKMNFRFPPCNVLDHEREVEQEKG
jgi:hypothetical protein